MIRQNIEILLNQVQLISKKYGEITKLTGENYNIFKILGLASNEVRTHSAFIGDLLNPKGSHDMGDIFLLEFLKQVSFRGEFNTRDSKVEIEKHVGFIDSKYDEGGRIDIEITDREGNCLIIENKIYAGDQHKQLTRYNNYNKKAGLIYLTLDGSNPGDKSVEGLLPDVAGKIKCISYKIDITEWLEECKKHAVNHSLLRETLTQYINLIKILTDQTINKKMEKEIVNLIINNETNFRASYRLHNSTEAILNELLNVLETQISEYVTKKTNLEISVFKIDRKKTYSGFSLTNTTLKELKLKISFEFVGSYTRNLMFGLCKLNPGVQLDEIKVGEIKKRFTAKFGTSENNDYWPCFVYFKEINNWGEEEFASIISGEMLNKIAGKIDDLLIVVNSENN